MHSAPPHGSYIIAGSEGKLCFHSMVFACSWLTGSLILCFPCGHCPSCCYIQDSASLGSPCGLQTRGFPGVLWAFSPGTEESSTLRDWAATGFSASLRWSRHCWVPRWIAGAKLIYSRFFQFCSSRETCLNRLHTKEIWEPPWSCWFCGFRSLLKTRISLKIRPREM